jgi:hypothetical protein
MIKVRLQTASTYSTERYIMKEKHTIIITAHKSIHQNFLEIFENQMTEI